MVSPLHPWRALGVATTSGLLGAALGRLSAPHVEGVETTQVVTASPPVVVQASPHPSPAPRDCRAELEALQAVVELQQEQLLGRPVGFDGVPEAFQPDVFERNLREAVAHCGLDAQGSTTLTPLPPPSEALETGAGSARGCRGQAPTPNPRTTRGCRGQAPTPNPRAGTNPHPQQAVKKPAATSSA